MDSGSAHRSDLSGAPSPRRRFLRRRSPTARRAALPGGPAAFFSTGEMLAYVENRPLNSGRRV